VTSPPPPPPDEPVDPTLAGPPPGGRRVVVDEAEEAAVVRPYPWWLWVLAAIFLALAVLFGVLWWLERDSGNEVPKLVGLNLTAAQSRANDAGFKLKTVRVTAAAVPNTVLEQAPQAGADLEDGSQMMAAVSAGQERATVPRVVGQTLPAAQQTLIAQGLTTETRDVDSPKTKGTVIAQDPDAGEQVVKGSTVTLAVSTGKGRVKVPNVQGMTQGEAVAAITDAGLVPIVIQVPSQQPEGTVLAQDPAANEDVAAQSKVRVNVSGGPASTQTRTVTTEQTTTESTTVTTVATTTTP